MEGFDEKSCGAVLYKMVDGVPHYVLVLGSVYGFPKGHVESGETETETALREISEETGVSCTLKPDFRREIEYLIPRTEGRMKKVVLFLSEIDGDSHPAAHSEIREVAVEPYEKAMRLLKHENLRRVLYEANAHILGQA